MKNDSNDSSGQVLVQGRMREAPLVLASVSRWRLVLLCLLLTVICLILFQRHELVRWIRFADDQWAGQRLRDVVGRLYWHEDWSEVPTARFYDYRWIPDAGELWIAHALGASGMPEQNSLRAYRDAKIKGYRFFEVDIWLTRDGLLRCHHGPGEPLAVRSAAAPSDDEECEFGQLLGHLTADDYLVLDLKTEFEATGGALLVAAAAKGATGRLIFQLYQPTDLRQFAHWQRQYHLVGPIVTMYRAHLPIWRALPPLQSNGYRAIAVPLDSVDHIPTSIGPIFLLSHPVHDCATLARLRSQAIHGFYSNSTLGC